MYKFNVGNRVVVKGCKKELRRLNSFMVTDVRLINKNGKDENYYSYDTLAWYHEDSLEVLDEEEA